MALDHIRDYFHFDAFLHDPLDLRFSPYPLFLTRWITNFCAPTFIFLTGLSAYLYGLKHTQNQLSNFLLTRGLWLIFLELTVVYFGWFFGTSGYHPLLMVIWAIGISMVFLALVSRLPYMFILIIGLCIVFLHNLLDGVHFTKGTIGDDFWILLHERGGIQITDNFKIGVLYPVLPYLGLICFGFAFGKVFSPQMENAKRKRILLVTGISCIALFVVLRFPNLYGDAAHWEHQMPSRYDFASFINTTKYPVSLLFALMTLGPSILFLYFFNDIRNWFTNILVTIGKVPMFYYIVHLYLLHLVAALTESSTTINGMGLPLKSHFHLGGVYLIWISIVLALYFPCKWYGKYKSAHPEKWWLSYL